MHPAAFIDYPRPKVLIYESLRLWDVLFRRNAAFQISQKVVLQPEENRMAKHSPARLQIAINMLRPRRILLPVRELVAVSLENKVGRFSPGHCWNRLTRCASVQCRRAED